MRDLNSFHTGLLAGKAVAHAILMGWHKGAADLGAVQEWADHLLPEGIPGSKWREGFRSALAGQGLQAG